jgi:hypothetical protein
MFHLSLANANSTVSVHCMKGRDERISKKYSQFSDLIERIVASIWKECLVSMLLGFDSGIHVTDGWKVWAVEICRVWCDPTLVLTAVAG